MKNNTDLIDSFSEYLLIDKNYSKNTIESYKNDLETKKILYKIELNVSNFQCISASMRR